METGGPIQKMMLPQELVLFDDHYVFNADGSFQNIMDGETWLEAWQGVESDQCGTPVAPHDGSNAATWEYDAAMETVTLNWTWCLSRITKSC